MMSAAHAQVQQQKHDILMGAFTNPVEAYLEYEPWKYHPNVSVEQAERKEPVANDSQLPGAIETIPESKEMPG